MARVPPVVQEACHLAESLFPSPAWHSKILLPARAPPGSIGTLQNSCYFFRVNLCPSRVDNVPLTSFGRAREWWDPTYVGLVYDFSTWRRCESSTLNSEFWSLLRPASDTWYSPFPWSWGAAAAAPRDTLSQGWTTITLKTIVFHVHSNGQYITGDIQYFTAK